jgi:hypothetical protein
MASPEPTPTELQELILVALRRHPAGEAPPTSYELAERISSARGIRSWERKPVTEAEGVSRALKRMEAKGWARRLGKSMGNSWCWAITDDGRTALFAAQQRRLATQETGG